MLNRAALFVSILLLSGCASLFNKVTYFDMAPRLSYQGFSFNRPSNVNWYLLKSEQNYTDVTLGRDFWSASRTHTFFASVSLGRIDRQPATHDEFAELVRSKGQQAPYEVRTVSYEQSLTTKQNQWCVRFESVHAVFGAPRAPDRELTLIVRGYRCLHPAFPQTTLDFFYSERGLPDEIDPELSREGEDFLDGVRIDIAPNTPAGQSSVGTESGGDSRRHARCAFAAHRGRCAGCVPQCAPCGGSHPVSIERSASIV